MDCSGAVHRLRIGVPATVEHSSQGGVETSKWIAETTQVLKFTDTLNPLTSITEFHYSLGCYQTKDEGERSAAAYYYGTDEWLFKIQQICRLGRAAEACELAHHAEPNESERRNY